MKTLFSLTLLAALTGPMYAVDGVVLINQSNALAGNVTPGDAPGFPVSITVSGSYRLSSNLVLSDANTDGINVSADNVTIDLNGFSIIGPVVCSGSPTVTSCSPQGGGVGISSNNTNVAVLNGDIHGTGGSAINLGSDSRVVNVHVANTGSNAIIVGSDSKVSSCIVNNNRLTGILTAGTGNNISGNIVKGNGFAGMQVNIVSLIEGNVAIHNGASNGDNIAAASGCVLVNNATP